ncbi:MAG: methyl-accepting chemotaxis protein [Alphaproteobacteria bacterium]
MLKTFSGSAAGGKLSIAAKIPLAIVASGLAVMLAVAGVSYWQARGSLVEDATQKLDAVVVNRASALHMYLDSIVDDLLVQADNRTVREALRAFDSAWDELGGEQTETLHRLYIEDNPNPLGEKHRLDFAPDGSQYSRVHAQYHPWMRQLLEAHEYYDIFLFDMDGNLVYTVFKELDFATNLNSGEWKDTDLGNAFRAARDGAADGGAYFFDFEPYAPSHDVPAAFFSAPIHDEEGRTIGVLAYQMPIARFTQVMGSTDGLGETGETYIVGEDLLMRSDARAAAESTILAVTVDNEAVRNALAGQSGDTMGETPTGESAAFAFVPFDFLGTHWAFIGSQNLSEITAAADNLALVVAAICVGAALLLAAVGLFIGRGISRPITVLSGRMGDLAGGNSAIDVPYEGRGDEVGLMARALGVLKKNTQEAERLRAEQRVRDEDARKAQRAALEQMARTIEAEADQAVSGVSAGSDEMTGTATHLSELSREMQGNAQAVAAASEESLASAETVAAAIEELSASIDQIRQRAAHSSTVAGNAKQISDETSGIVASLGEAASQIGEVVALISQIAEQTNLLALNATIEAARAGEAGKGFAVVAAEVKNLATQTQRSTGDISAHVATVQAVADKAVDAIARIQKTVDEMSVASGDISDSVNQQSEAVGAIGESVRQAAAGAREVAAQIGQVTRQIGDADHMAEAVAKTAAELRQSVDALSGSLKQSVRAAVG